MKYTINEQQYKVIKEYFAPLERLKKYFSGHFGTMDDYLLRKEMKKFVDLIYKYTKKNNQLDGVKGFRILSMNPQGWGHDFNNPEKKPARMDYTVRLYPILDKSNPPESNEVFLEQYEKFRHSFLKNAQAMGFESIAPLEREQGESKIIFMFVRIDDLKNVKNLSEEKESDAKWIKCRNCKKKFTQTIHKDKKSSPICPNCGTHN